MGVLAHVGNLNNSPSSSSASSRYPIHMFAPYLERAVRLGQRIDTVMSYGHGTLQCDLLRVLEPLRHKYGIGLLSASPLGLGLLSESPLQNWLGATPEMKVGDGAL